VADRDTYGIAGQEVVEHFHWSPEDIRHLGDGVGTFLFSPTNNRAINQVGGLYFTKIVIFNVLMTFY
jgi:hypothetical protein